VRRAAIIITDDLWVHHWVHNNDGALETREVDASEQLLADLLEAVECVEAEAQWTRQAERPDYAEADRLDAVHARLHAALGAP